jgi:hypothetical protein
VDLFTSDRDDASCQHHQRNFSNTIAQWFIQRPLTFEEAKTINQWLVSRVRVAAAPTTMDIAMSAGNSEHSILPSKRPLPRDSDDKENDGVQSTPKSKRSALAHKTNAKAPQVALAWKSTAKPTNTSTKPSSLPGNSSDWDVTGKYRLKCSSRYKPVDASNYSLEIHYQAGPPGQLYATFVFGNLRGIMRLCSSSSLKSNTETGVVQPFFLDELKLHATYLKDASLDQHPRNGLFGGEVMNLVHWLVERLVIKDSSFSKGMEPIRPPVHRDSKLYLLWFIKANICFSSAPRPTIQTRIPRRAGHWSRAGKTDLILLGKSMPIWNLTVVGEENPSHLQLVASSKQKTSPVQTQDRSIGRRPNSLKRVHLSLGM